MDPTARAILTECMTLVLEDEVKERRQQQIDDMVRRSNQRYSHIISSIDEPEVLREAPLWYEVLMALLILWAVGTFAYFLLLSLSGPKG